MNKKILIFILFLMLMLPNTVLAYRIPCTTKNLNKLKNDAYKVNITYEFRQEETNYFEIYVSGLTQELELRYGNIMVNYDASKETQTIITNEGGNTTLYFDLYAAEGSACDGHKVLTKSVTLPKYNIYSEREECIDYEEFRLCNKWCKEDIPNETYFEEEFYKYKESLEQGSTKPQKPKTNVFQKFINFYLDNAVITIPVTVILALGIIFVLVRNIIRRKNRIKIDIKR